jgi:hypothetical protein
MAMFKELPVGALFQVEHEDPRLLLCKTEPAQRKIGRRLCIFNATVVGTPDLFSVDAYDSVIVVDPEDEQIVAERALLRLLDTAVDALFEQMEPPPAWAQQLRVVAYWEDRDAVMRAIQPYKGEARPLVHQPISSSAGEAIVQIEPDEVSA